MNLLPHQLEPVRALVSVLRERDLAIDCSEAGLGKTYVALAVAKAALGELSRIEAVVKLFGMVNAEPEFSDHPKVINGCSDLMVEVFGDAGRHARSAVGVYRLPRDFAVEIDAVVEIS